MTTLNTYEAQVADLLHEQYPNPLKWTLTQLDNYINEARTQLAMDTGCLRNLQSSFITFGQEQYVVGQVTGAQITAGGANYSGPTVSFSGGGGSGVAATLTQSGGAVNAITFTSFGSGYTSAPIATVSDSGAGAGAQISVGILNLYTYDILDIHVTWGSQRYTLGWQVFSEFSANFRPFTAATYQRQPACWAAYNDTTIFIGPTPDQTYPVEFDSVLLPAPLSDYVTADTIPLKLQTAIKFYAAGLAKENMQSFGEAESFYGRYQKRLAELGATGYIRRIPDAYSGSG